MGIRVDSVQDVIPLADFIADVAGESVEVALHDITDAEVSIVYIRNGALSGRKVGDGTTDVALKLIHEGHVHDAEYMANYAGKSLGDHNFRCATYFIKNHDEKLIGLLCVNVLVNGLEAAVKTLNSFLYGGAKADDASRCVHSIEENLLGSPDDTIRRITRSVLSRYDVTPKRLSRAERLEALRSIHEEGVFLMKGSVPIVAEEMDISVPTCYKYLKEIKQ